MNSWLRISWCNSLSHFKLQVVDSLTFQAKYWNKSSLFYLRILLYPINTWFGHQNKYLFHLEKWLFPNHSYPTTKSYLYLIQYLPRKFCLSFRPSSVVVVPVPRPPKKLRYFRVFSLFNVILCRSSGGVRQYPRSGYFLVSNNFY